MHRGLSPVAAIVALFVAGSACTHRMSEAFCPQAPLQQQPHSRRFATELKRASSLSTSAEKAVSAVAVESSDAPPLRRTKPRRVALMIEPTPFTHVSGYSNRFNELLRFLSKAGDKVEVVTTESEAKIRKSGSELPKSRFGYKIREFYTMQLATWLPVSLFKTKLTQLSLQKSFLCCTCFGKITHRDSLFLSTTISL